MHAIESWASLYANHAALKTAVQFLHVGGLLAGGGCAIAADRTTLLVFRMEAAARALQLGFLKTTHRVVVGGLACTIASGLLLLGADLDTFLYSKVFWLKMGLLALLLANGAVLLAAERRVERGDARGWARLRGSSVASLVLWFATTCAGVGITNIG